VLIGYLDRYSSLLLDSAETRYLKLLKERPELIQQVPLYMVASYLGITPEALSRVRNKIAQTGA
ncbi:MAG TPA: Crp/Fnr family transcriptional regulator, partial [Catalimonadaceae bacterium]|nr:Crp/Fnr family transcriptional regulator [Catalimonadaceae bacterium]